DTASAHLHPLSLHDALPILGNTSLEKEKAQIQEELRKLERKIVVFVDDLDRLEPNEVVEVLRLVRAVVDFPNVIYVLCYSRDIIDRKSTRLNSSHVKISYAV